MSATRKDIYSNLTFKKKMHQITGIRLVILIIGILSRQGTWGASEDEVDDIDDDDPDMERDQLKLLSVPNKTPHLPRFCAKPRKEWFNIINACKLLADRLTF
jgi:hypothetical protein